MDNSDLASYRVYLDIGGRKYTTTVDTLTQRDPNSMLAAMFSGRHTVPQDPDTGVVFIDRDGKHFRHVLNWLRDGIIASLKESEYEELLREAEYYQLMGLVEHIKMNLNKKKDEDGSEAELTRTDVVKCIQSERVRFRGLNLSGLDLSKLDLSFVDFSYSCIRNTFFSRAYLQCAKFRDVDADGSIFHNAILREYGTELHTFLVTASLSAFLDECKAWITSCRCEFTGAKLRGALLAGANLQSANLQDACLIECSFCGADLRSAHLQAADLTAANFEGANLEGANLKGAKVTGANFQGANLQRAYLRQVDLREAQMDGAKLIGANTMGAIR